MRTEIQRSIFLKEDVKKKLLNNLERVNAHDLETLSALFGHAEKRQDALIGKIVKHDDSFLPRIKFFIKGVVRKYRAGVEKTGRKKEKAEDILKDLG